MPDSTIKQFDPLTNVNPTDICWVVSDPDNTQKDCHSKIDDMLAGGAANGACAGLIKTKLEVSRALVSNASGNITVSDITSAELAYLDGVASNIQNQLNTKLNTSGGTITGDITLSGDISINTSANFAGTLLVIDAADSSDCSVFNIKHAANGWKLKYLGSGSSNDNSLVFYSGNTSSSSGSKKIEIKQNGDIYLSGNILPETTQTNNIGSAGLEFQDIYLKNSPIVSSDKRIKKNIQKLSNSLDFINKLKPVSFEYQNAKEKRPHTGFLAQDVKQSMEDTGIDYAVYCYDKESDRHFLRYEEFIAILCRAIQEQNSTIEQLVKRVKILEEFSGKND